MFWNNIENNNVSPWNADWVKPIQTANDGRREFSVYPLLLKLLHLRNLNSPKKAMDRLIVTSLGVVVYILGGNDCYLYNDYALFGSCGYLCG